MNKVLKLTSYLSLMLIFIWLFRRILFWLIGLEVTDNEFLLKYSFSWRYILPIAIFLTIFLEYVDGEKPNSLLVSVIARFFLSAFAVSMVYATVFTHMCGSFEKEVYYINEQNNGKVILLEEQCGALDSDTEPKIEVRKIIPINDYLQWNFKCDTTKLNLNKWKKIQEEKPLIISETIKPCLYHTWNVITHKL